MEKKKVIIDKCGSFCKKVFKSEGFSSILTSVICILIGLLIGFIVLLCIAPKGALVGIKTIILNFFTYTKSSFRLKYFGKTLVYTAPLILCGLSVLFAYKTGLFNIGAAGQYTVATGVAIIAAVAWNCPWYVCLFLAILAGAFWGSLVGFLKAFFSINEVISAIMLNWIGLYLINMCVKNSSAWDSIKYETVSIEKYNPSALLPSIGLDKLFNFQYAGIGLLFAIIIPIIIFIILKYTTFGYELKATGFNKSASEYAGMKGKFNTIITMAISGGLAGLGAGVFYLSGVMPYYCPTSGALSMGFNGISSAFLGGLSPIGTIFSSYFLTHISQAGALLDTTYYSSQISDLISSIIIYLCAFTHIFKYLLKKAFNKKDKETNVSASDKKDEAFDLNKAIEEVDDKLLDNKIEETKKETSNKFKDSVNNFFKKIKDGITKFFDKIKNLIKKKD